VLIINKTTDTMRCASCNHDNRAGRRFCAECGAALAAPCAACGASNEPGEKFCGGCGCALSNAPAARLPSSAARAETPRTALRVRPEATIGEIPEGERKTVTALFADIKGSTELEQDLDPEEARAIVDPALKLMIDAARQYDGYVVQSTGDGIFALFGAPVAHEDHPQRALYSAIRMQEELRRYGARLQAEGRAPVEIRIGVNTGEVVVRPIQTGEGQIEYTPIGHTTNLAARLQSIARTGSIVASEQTRKLVEGYFELKSLGPTKMKGVSEHVNVHEVTGLGPLRTRLQRSLGRGLSKFVGRHSEMEAIKRALELARGGRGQIVAAIGEAGVGKSRLFYEFKAIARSGCLTLEAFSVSHGKALACQPLIDLLRNYFEITPLDDERKRREKVTGKVLALDRALEDSLPYLFSMLGIGEGAESPVLNGVDPQLLRKRTFDALKRMLSRESLNQPLLIVFEDLHWVDNETQEFLDLLADGIANARVLLLVNYRPEYRHDWGARSYYTQLRLDPLGKDSAEEMLGALFGEQASAKDGATTRDGLQALKRFIIEKTQGNPFFMEEMVQALYDQGALVRDGGGVTAAMTVAEIKIPATVQGILASRIDRLVAGDKELLQTLAVIGKEFPLGLVMRVAPGPDEQLQRSLSNLQLAEFIYEQSAFPEVEYTFKHALTLEVAYNSMLTERRKAMHERIGRAMEEQFAGRLGDHFGELARHYSRAAKPAKAIEYLRLAAQQAAERSSYTEAISYVNNGLEILAGLPQSEQRDRDELQLRVTLGLSLMAAEGFDSDEVESAFRRASVLARELKETIFQFAVLNGLWGFHFTRGHVNQAVEISQDMMAVAEQLKDPESISSSHTAMGAALHYAGDLPAARRHLEQAAAVKNASGSRAGSYHFGPDPTVICLTTLGGVLLELGYPDQALKRAKEAMAAVDAASDPFSMVMAMVFNGEAHCARREAAKGGELARAVVAMCEEKGYPFWLSVGRRMVGWALMLQGQLREAIDLMEEDLQRFTGPAAEMVHYRSLLSIADCYSHIGEPHRALALLDQWHALRAKVELNMADSYYYRLRGRLSFRAGAYDEAEASYHKAIEAARIRNSKSDELRVATELALLLDKQGRRDEACRTLADTYGWFTEGFDTGDLKQAKSLVEELSARPVSGEH